MDIANKLCEALANVFLELNIEAQSDITIRSATAKKFGDYQVNCIMQIASRLKTPPLLLADRVAACLKKAPALAGMVAKVDVVPPGFINIFLSDNALALMLEAALADERLGVAKEAPQTVVVDYSSPNVAKEMHVGHLRSTIIGDAVVRTLRFLGHRVIRANHIGDWGTQFGMLIALLEERQQESDGSLSGLEAFYREAKRRDETDAAFSARAREYVVRLQQGDAHCRALWKQLVQITMEQNQHTYQRLNVTLTPQDIMGESLYNPMLPGIVGDLLARGIAEESRGAVVVYLPEYQNKEGEPMGVIIRKKDGAYLYTTTDIACAKYRYETLHADRMLYYIDARQHQHLMQAWAIVRRAGYVPPEVPMEHHMFGVMLDKSGRPFKTREGGTVKLSDLLDEAVFRAGQLVSVRAPHLDPAEQHYLANVIGIGAVKYADLSKNRTTDYVFDWDNMLSFEGNTAPYIQYAHARIASILRRLQVEQVSGPLVISNEKERDLALRLVQFEETLRRVARDGTPHVLCAWLYDLAGAFSSFYAACPVINAQAPAQTASRLKLAALTARTLKAGLNLLGIEAPERM
ncbi:arginine--tRNA ligase [Pluralibacter gergoviae]|uniref:arginine--tRNA ligase n=1 Tax=Pluralibacter gergoviae TaxID=61647 RepID=UPI002853FA74|nr:arginine--tRNA ligase [Pluralibacter gergoviae]ELG9929807.1 arginine--tRNA ligase [Pluralibacter gergoviae]ELK5592167.1 arginine--tRNA ligase [Pluralibacter gergoviae]